jgi:hypothetical protein
VRVESRVEHVAQLAVGRVCPSGRTL